MKGKLRKLGVWATMVIALSAMAGCADDSDELQDIERGRDNPPAIDASPPEEQN